MSDSKRTEEVSESHVGESLRDSQSPASQRDAATWVRMPRRERWFLAGFASPPLILAGLIGWGVVREMRAGAKVQSFVATHVDDWPGLTPGGLTREFDRHTSRENTGDWNSILLSVERYRDDADDAVESLKSFVPPGQPWPAEPYAKRLASESEAVAKLRDAMPDTETPVWMPVNLEGDYVYPSDLPIVRILLKQDAHAFRVAYHEGDNVKAMNVLRRIDDTIDSWDWRWPGSLYWTQFQDQKLSLIRGSLKYDVWSDEELKELRSMVMADWQIERRFEQDVKALLASNLRTLATAGQSDRNWTARSFQELAPLGVSSTHVWQWIRSRNRILELPGVGSFEHVDQVNEIEEGLRLNRDARAGVSLVSVPYARPGDVLAPFHDRVRSMATQFAEIERDRRWTRAAIGLRIYRREFDRWPDELGDLSRVGMGGDLYSERPNQPLAYQISEDGSEARVWNPMLLKDAATDRMVFNYEILPIKTASNSDVDEDRVARLRTGAG